MNTKISVCVHADDPISRAGLESALCSRPEISLVDMAAVAPSPLVAIVAVNSLDELSRLLRQVSRLQRQVLSPMGLGLGGLSAREIDVLRLAADGFDTDEIALKLSYSRRTIANIFHDVTTRFHLNNRTHAVAYARLVSPG